MFLLLVQATNECQNTSSTTANNFSRCPAVSKALISRRKFSKSTVRYTVNGTSTFNPTVITLKLLISGDVELNPGDDNKDHESEQLKLPNRGLRIGQWNIEHLTDTKFEQISLILKTCNNIDILFLLETFLKPFNPDSVYNIPGYNLYRKDRDGTKAGGGLLAYVADRVRAKRMYEHEDDGIESMWFNVCPHKSNRPILVGALYRPPSTNADTDNKIEHHIESAYLRSQEMILVGDININYLNQNTYSKHRLAKAFKSLNMFQHVNVVTRPKSETCLDHVYSTNSNFISEIIVPNIGMADHLPVFACRKYFAHKKNSGHKVINYFDFKNLNTDALLDDLRNSPWDSAFVFDDVDDILNALELVLNQAVKEHIPLKQKRVKKSKQPDWLNNSIINAITQRDKELREARKSNNPNNWAKYKRTKCFVTNLIRKSKRNYFQESIDKNKGNPKEIWKAMKSLTKAKKLSKITEMKRDDGTSETDAHAIVNMLNEFFVNIASNLQTDTTPTEMDTIRLEDFVSSTLNNCITQFNIPAISVQDTQRMIDQLSIGKATGPDDVSVRLLKIIAPVFCEPLTQLFNLSIVKGRFPSKWKVARVTPLHKDGVRDCRDNYRPISVLSVLSKLLEKHVASHLMNYMVQNDLLYKLQSAFRDNHSTESALIHLTDQILFNLDQDEVTGMVLLIVERRPMS